MGHSVKLLENVPVCILSINEWELQLLYILSHISYFACFILGILVDLERHHIMVAICIALVTDGVELFWYAYQPFGNKCFVHFSIRLSILLIL